MTECNSSNFQLDLSNFQSIADAHMEFIKGINIIVGQSNSGKSATLRAVKANLLNTSGAHRFIKHGTEDAAVSIKYKDNDINWFRTKKESKYTVNNEEYIKVGNSNLFKILENNGFVVDDKNNLMNIESELELPFPFDRTSSELFKLFENIFCVSDSATILKLMKDEEDKNTRDKVKVEEEISKINSKLEALQSLSEEVDLEKLKKGREKLLNLISKKESLQSNVEIVEKVALLINTLKLKVDKKDYSNDTVDKYLSLVKNYNKIKNTKELINVEQDLLKIKNIKLDVKTQSLQRLEKLNKNYNKLIKVNNLVSICNNLEIKDFNDTDLNDYIKLRNNYLKIEKNRKDARELRDRKLLEEKNLATIEEQLKQFKVCPLCGSNIGDENE